MLNFPSSPVDGQAYDQWVYSSAKGAWLAKPLEPMAAVPSPVAPAFPQPGDMWFNTNEVTTYVYYDDGNSSQWVEMVAQTGLPQPLAIAQGGTGATTVAGAQDSLRVGLVPISPTSVEKAGAGSTASANTLGQVSFASCTSVSLNGVFTSAYKNYRIVYRCSSSAAQGIYMRLRAITDNDTANYYLSGNASTSSGSVVAYALNATTACEIGAVANGWTMHGAMDIFSPNQPQVTRAALTAAGHNNTNPTGYFAAITHNVATAFNGVTIYPAGTTAIEGTIQVFGYNE